MKKKDYKSKQSEDNLTIEYDRDDFETSLPNLAAELKNEKIQENATIPIDGVRVEGEEDEEKEKEEIEVRPKELYDPGVCDFIRRCSTEEEALEIIDYCLRREEIDEERAKELKKQLAEKGVRSFGALKRPGYYERKYLRTTDFGTKKEQKNEDSSNSKSEKKEQINT